MSGLLLALGGVLLVGLWRGHFWVKWPWIAISALQLLFLYLLQSGEGVDPYDLAFAAVSVIQVAVLITMVRPTGRDIRAQTGD